MKKRRYGEEQIIGLFKQVEAGVPVARYAGSMVSWMPVSTCV